MLGLARDRIKRIASEAKYKAIIDNIAKIM